MTTFVLGIAWPPAAIVVWFLVLQRLFAALALGRPGLARAGVGRGGRVLAHRGGQRRSGAADRLPLAAARRPAVGQTCRRRPRPSTCRRRHPEDFPQFLGPRRDARLTGIRLRRDWQAQPPRLVWRHEIGAGWSTFAAVNGFAVTMEQRGDEELVTCYEVATGDAALVSRRARAAPDGAGRRRPAGHAHDPRGPRVCARRHRRPPLPGRRDGPAGLDRGSAGPHRRHTGRRSQGHRLGTRQLAADRRRPGGRAAGRAESTVLGSRWRLSTKRRDGWFGRAAIARPATVRPCWPRSPAGGRS